MEKMFTVEIRADNKTWFTATEASTPMTAEEADELVKILRVKGFTARGRFAD
jgi:hypothetical protein